MVYLIPNGDDHITVVSDLNPPSLTERFATTEYLMTAANNLDKSTQELGSHRAVSRCLDTLEKRVRDPWVERLSAQFNLSSSRRDTVYSDGPSFLVFTLRIHYGVEKFTHGTVASKKSTTSLTITSADIRKRKTWFSTPTKIIRK